MDVSLSVEPELERLVRVGALWCDVGRVSGSDPGLDAPLAAAEIAARDCMTPVLDMTAMRLAEYAGGQETARWVS